MHILNWGKKKIKICGHMPSENTSPAVTFPSAQ